MLRKILFFVSFWLFMLYCLVMLIPYAVMFLPIFKKRQQHLVYFMQWLWSRFCILLSGVKLKVSGRENIPKDNVYCVVSNHQGAFDIPILMSIFPWTLGFITKKELMYFPILNFWMAAVGCVFLDRRRSRNAILVFEKATKQLRGAHPMAIFPEGTRSKGNRVADFKPGALKLPIKAQVPIIPVSIDGSSIFEGGNKSNEIFVTIHPKVEFSEIADLETAQIAVKIREIITSAMREK
jgi:1-acyl-sn-glycerol-3-phosphate acyltransferase